MGQRTITHNMAPNPLQSNIAITQERPDAPDALILINELEEFLATLYLPKNRLGFSVEKLISQGVAFFVLRADDIPAACGGIFLVDGEYGELKRMYVRPQYRRHGYAKLIMERLAEYTRKHGVTLLRLETGVYQQDAVRLYEDAGFRRIPPFGPYTESEINLCYEKLLM